MKWKYMMAALAVACTAISCDDNLETFERNGYAGTPVGIADMAYTSLPGQIQLNWSVPEKKEFAYMKLWYEDPLKKGTVHKIVSSGTTEMILDGTRARFGEYEIFYQTFNINDEGGEVKSLKAISGAAPATITIDKKKMKIKPDNVSANFSCYYGDITDLVDGAVDGYMLSDNPDYDWPYNQWVEMKLEEPLTGFMIGVVQCAYWGADYLLTEADIEVSVDGENWTLITSLSGLPGSTYTTEYLESETPFTYFRFVAQAGANWYWSLDEIILYKAVRNVYDPETEILE